MNVLKWSADGSYDAEVVGESNYQDDLKHLAGGERRKQTTARLICESNNQYDPKAVRVEIGGKTIGHLSREDARAHRRKLDALKKAGAVVETPAVIVTGSEGACGVYLDVPEEDEDEPDLTATPARPRRRASLWLLIGLGFAVIFACGAIVTSNTSAAVLAVALLAVVAWQWRRSAR